MTPSGVTSTFSALGRRGSPGEEICEDKPAARVAREYGTERHKPTLVPLDHRLERLYNHQRSHLRMLQRRRGRVAEPQTSDHDVDFALT